MCVLHPSRWQRTLNAYQCILVIAALNLLVEREQHPLAVVTVATDAAVLNHPPLSPTVRCQHVAPSMVPLTTKGGPIVEAMELANLGALLHKLKLPSLLADLVQGHLAFVDIEQDVLRVCVLLCLLLWNGYSLQLPHCVASGTFSATQHATIACRWPP